VFTLVAKDDLFQYYEELLQQLRVVKAQAETLDIKMDLPANVEQNLLLIAAWQDPRYRDIAEEISRKKRAFTVDELLRDLHQQQLLTRHLRSLRQGEGAIRTGCEDQGSQGKYEAVLCFSRGECTRANCPYAHVKATEARRRRPSPARSPLRPATSAKEKTQKLRVFADRS